MATQTQAEQDEQAAQAENEVESQETPELEVSPHEIHLPGDREKQEAADRAAEEEESQDSTETSEQGASVQTEAEGEEEEPQKGRLELLREQAKERAGEKEEGQDPRDAEIAKYRQMADQALEAQIAALKEQRGQTGPVEVEEDADPSDVRAQRIQAAAAVLEEHFNNEDLTVKEQSQVIAAAAAELGRMDAEELVEAKLSPYVQKLEAQEQERQQQETLQAIAGESVAGLRALEERGGMAKELVDDFRSNGLEGSYLGRALASGWDQKVDRIPPAFKSRHMVEAMGIALAVEFENYLNGQGDVPEAAAAGAQGITPKKRSNRPANPAQQKSEEAAQKLLEETMGNMGDFTSAIGLDSDDAWTRSR